MAAAGVDIPRPAPIGRFWERATDQNGLSNADNYDRWTEPGKNIAKARQSFRALLEKWIAEKRGLQPDREGNIIAPDNQNEDLVRMLAVMADPVGDERTAGVRRVPDNTFYRNGEPTDYNHETGLVGKFYRLASMTLSARLQHTYTDEQEVLAAKFEKMLMRLRGNALARTANSIAEACILFLNLMGSLVAEVDMRQWQELNKMLLDIASVFSDSVPDIITVPSWLSFVENLKEKVRIPSADKLAQLQARRNAEYFEQQLAEYWEKLPIQNYRGYDQGAGGECLFLSIAYLRGRIRGGPESFGSLNRWERASDERKNIYGYMLDETRQSDFVYWREKVLANLIATEPSTGKTGLKNFFEKDCNEVFADEATMRAVTYSPRGLLLLSLDKIGTESTNQMNERKTRIFKQWCTIMMRSKNDILNTFLSLYNARNDFVTPNVQANWTRLLGFIRNGVPGWQERYLGDDVTFVQKIKDWVFRGHPYTRVAFGDEIAIEAAAWYYRMRINVYVYPVRANFVRKDSFGRLSWRPWRALLWMQTTDPRTGEADVEPVVSGFHFQPIVLRGNTGGTAFEPAGTPPGIPAGDERPAPDMPLVEPYVPEEDDAASKAAFTNAAEARKRALEQGRKLDEAKRAEAAAAAAEEERQREARKAAARLRSEQEERRKAAAEEARRRSADQQAAQLAEYQAEQRAKQAALAARDDAEAARVRAALKRKARMRKSALTDTTNRANIWSKKANNDIQQYETDRATRQAADDLAAEQRRKDAASLAKNQRPPPLQGDSMDTDRTTTTLPDADAVREAAARRTARIRRRLKRAAKEQGYGELPEFCDPLFEDRDKLSSLEEQLCQTFQGAINPDYDWSSGEED